MRMRVLYFVHSLYPSLPVMLAISRILFEATGMNSNCLLIIQRNLGINMYVGEYLEQAAGTHTIIPHSRFSNKKT